MFFTGADLVTDEEVRKTIKWPNKAPSLGRGTQATGETTGELSLAKQRGNDARNGGATGATGCRGAALAGSLDMTSIGCFVR